MRCATCGTENAPDSRFCGECGARTPSSNVAPTQKISDDAPMPPPSVAPVTYAGQVYATGPATLPPANYNSIPPQNAYSRPPTNTSVPPQNNYSQPPQNESHSQPPTNNSVPPQSLGTGSIPPTNQPRSHSESFGPGTVQRRASAPPIAPQPSVSMPAKKRGTRWGVVLVVLAIDLSLAAAGAWMLRTGLAASDATAGSSPASESAPAKSSAAPTDSTAVPASAATLTTTPASTTVASTPATAVTTPVPTTDAKSTTPKSTSTAKPPTTAAKTSTTTEAGSAAGTPIEPDLTLPADQPPSDDETPITTSDARKTTKKAKKAKKATTPDSLPANPYDDPIPPETPPQ